MTGGSGTGARGTRLESMRHKRSPILALAATLILAACGGGEAPSPRGSGVVGGLEGRTFLSTAVEGRTLVSGSTIRISFRGGQVSASAGCNSMSGAYRIDSGRLVATTLAMTDMGCTAPLMAQDQWVAELLNGSTIKLDGTSLTLARATVRVTLLDRVVADPDRPLLGTRWVLDGIIAGDAVSSVPSGVSVAITLSNGRIAVEAGCNGGSGTATVSSTTITLGAIGLTTRACAADVMGVEMTVMAVLRGTVTYAIEARTLTLIAGSRGLMLRSAP